jgi:hypothetical protein
MIGQFQLRYSQWHHMTLGGESCFRCTYTYRNNQDHLDTQLVLWFPDDPARRDYYFWRKSMSEAYWAHCVCPASPVYNPNQMQWWCPPNHEMEPGDCPPPPNGNSDDPIADVPPIPAAPDGKKAKYPIHVEQSGDHSYAKVDIDQSGSFSLNLEGTHSGFTGSTDFTAAVVVSGFKDGKPHIVLNKPSRRTKTVAVDQSTGTNKENQTFTDLSPIAPEDIDNMRNVSILIAVNKSGTDFVSVVSGILSSAGQLFSEADALYKEVEGSDLGQAIAVAAAS